MSTPAFSRAAYDQLKLQVSEIRTAQKQARKAFETAKEADAASTELKSVFSEMQEKWRNEVAERMRLNDKLQRTNEEWQKLLDQRLEDQRRLQQQQMAGLRSQRSKEMEAIQAKLEVVVDKKDTIIAQLRQQLQAAQMRMQATEQLLQQHKRELLGGAEA